jgi:hypothetical protein
MLIGTASATLVGLMFVAASIGSSVFRQKDLSPLRAFLTPTVVHFVAILFGCLLFAMPGHSWLSLGGLLGAGALAGLIYCGGVLARIFGEHRAKIDWEDRIFYGLLPGLGYLLLLISAAMELTHSTASAVVVAAAFMILLTTGLRNAWDMTVWMVLRTPTGPPPGPDADAVS